MCPARQFNYTNLTGWVETNAWQNRRLFYIFDNEFYDRHCQLSAGRQKWPSRLIIVDFKFATDNVTFSMRKKRNGVVVMSLSSSTLTFNTFISFLQFINSLHLQLCAQ
jgi:hypothetical protein